MKKLFLFDIEVNLGSRYSFLYLNTEELEISKEYLAFIKNSKGVMKYQVKFYNTHSYSSFKNFSRILNKEFSALSQIYLSHEKKDKNKNLTCYIDLIYNK